MRKKLHPLVLTVAIFQVVFGLLALACDGFGVLNASGLFIMDSAPPPAAQPQAGTKGQPTPGETFERGMATGMEANATILQNAPSYKYVQLGQAFFGLFLVMLMIASGCGLFFMHSWARWLAIGYGMLSLLGRCSCVGYHAVVVLPLLSELGDKYIKSGNPDLNSNLAGVKYLPFGGLLLALYPLLVIILLLLPAVGRAFSAEPVSTGPDDFRDRDDFHDRFRSERDDDRFGSR